MLALVSRLLLERKTFMPLLPAAFNIFVPSAQSIFSDNIAERCIQTGLAPVGRLVAELLCSGGRGRVSAPTLYRAAVFRETNGCESMNASLPPFCTIR